MRTAFLSVRDVRAPWTAETERALAEDFARVGMYADEIVSLSQSDEQGFVNRFNALKDVTDNLVVFVGEEAEFSVPAAIAKCMQAEMKENDRAKEYVEAYFRAQGLRPAYRADELSLLPEGATVLPNSRGFRQGFMMEDDDLWLIVLPGSAEEAEETCRQYVFPYVETKLKVRTDRFTLKLFGGERKEIEETLKEAVRRSRRTVSYLLTGEDCDWKAELLYNAKTPKMVLDDAMTFLVTEFGPRMYSDRDERLEERLYEVLKLHGLRLAVAESFTGGNVAARIVSVPGASEVLREGVVAYANEAKVARLGVSEETLASRGAVSSETAYEMAAGLLSVPGVTAAIATTGIAGPASDGTDKPVGLCYIAVGTADGIHVYKYRLSGGRERITRTATNAALYLSIRKFHES